MERDIPLSPQLFYFFCLRIKGKGKGERKGREKGGSCGVEESWSGEAVIFWRYFMIYARYYFAKTNVAVADRCVCQ